MTARNSPAGRVSIQHVAYHEAGHAVVAWNYGRRIESIDMTTPAVELRYRFTASIAYGVEIPIAPDRIELVAIELDADTRDRFLPNAEREAQILLAGTLALQRRHRHISTAIALVLYGESEDLRRALNLALAFNGHNPEAADLWLEEQRKRATKLLREPGLWAAVEALADRLTPSTRLRGPVAEKLIAGAVRRAKG